MITAIFDSQNAARDAIESIKSTGVEDGRISYLTPGDAASSANSAAGTGTAIGTALGGVLGMGAATFLIPGIGPIAGLGLLAGAVAGAGAGAAAGSAIDRKTDIPRQDIYFYEEALRNGQTVVLVEAGDPEQETQVRHILEHAGGRSADTVRREWWHRIRDSERDYLQQRGYDFTINESDYAAGFEAALHPETRGRAYDEVVVYVERCYPEPCKTDVFRIGFDRGRQFLAGASGGSMH